MKKLTVPDICERLKALESADGIYLALAQEWALEAYRDLREDLVVNVTSVPVRPVKFLDDDEETRRLQIAEGTEASRPSAFQGAVPARRERAGVLTDMDAKIEQRLKDVDKVNDVHLLKEWLKEHLRENRATRAWMRVWRKDTKNIASEIDAFLSGDVKPSQEI